MTGRSRPSAGADLGRESLHRQGADGPCHAPSGICGLWQETCSDLHDSFFASSESSGVDGGSVRSGRRFPALLEGGSHADAPQTPARHPPRRAPTGGGRRRRGRRDVRVRLTGRRHAGGAAVQGAPGRPDVPRSPAGAGGSERGGGCDDAVLGLRGRGGNTGRGRGRQVADLGPDDAVLERRPGGFGPFLCPPGRHGPVGAVDEHHRAADLLSQRPCEHPGFGVRRWCHRNAEPVRRRGVPAGAEPQLAAELGVRGQRQLQHERQPEPGRRRPEGLLGRVAHLRHRVPDPGGRHVLAAEGLRQQRVLLRRGLRRRGEPAGAADLAGELDLDHELRRGGGRHPDQRRGRQPVGGQPGRHPELHRPGLLQLPAGWGARTQTLTLGGSTDGTAFTTLKSSAAHTFDPSTRNTVTLTFPAATQRYFRVTITANSGWPAGQVSEFQIWTS
ncbi:discoidin domain-containing protein [Streptomyces sp. S1D4-14]|nr:discoidin domain-containing protein [Streptomyces sp. S1D4-20]QDN71634.1 discoidin domain-containing protein [Streptomyces sp. S1D4-14]QDO54091.1 discoidin domain-containing protein [Streptomyces sp. RLB3-5]QDO64336.1 discoidin domain-containing protein [Streptomyces sp. RLB1-8]